MSNGPDLRNPTRLNLDSATVLEANASTADRSALKPEEQSLLDLANGQRPVSEILRLSDLSATLTMRMLHSLCERSFLQPYSGVRPSSVESPLPPLAHQGISSFVARKSAEPFSRPGITQDLTDFIEKIADKRTLAMPVAGEDPFATAASPPGSKATLRGIEPIRARESGGHKVFEGVAKTKSPPPAPRPGVKSTSGELASRLPPPDPVLDRPTRAGAYEVVTRMAQGAVGSIYLCRRAGSQQFQHLYVLKVIRQHSEDGEAAAESFMREARVSMLVTHPNILPILDFGHYQDQPFLLMEYIEGTSLAELLMEGTPCPPPLIVPVVIDVLRALQRAHEAVDEKERPLGLVHGDVSPQNILVGTDGAARLTDFGSCRFTALADGSDHEGATMAKPAYMAPEQLKGEPTDARTDLFSLGVVLWTALTGRSLFADPNHSQTVMNTLRKPVMPPSHHGAPRAFDEICSKALNRNRAMRFHSAEEMAQALIMVAAELNLLPGDRAVGAWVQQTTREVLLERRLHLKDVATGKTKPVTVVAEGMEDPPAETATAREPAQRQGRGETMIIEPVRPARPRPPSTTETSLAAVSPAALRWLTELRTWVARLWMSISRRHKD